MGIWNESSAIIGLCPDNPAVTPRHHCRYDVCLPVEAAVREDDLVSIQTIPGGHYVTLRASCEVGDVLGLWKYLTTQWLPGNNVTRGMHHSYEYYPLHAACDSSTGFDVELCLRIVLD